MTNSVSLKVLPWNLKWNKVDDENENEKKEGVKGCLKSVDRMIGKNDVNLGS